MLINKIANEKVLRVILVVLVSYYFMPILTRSNIIAMAFFGVVVLVLIFIKRVEYAFYFIIASRSLVDIYLFNAQFAGRPVPQLVGVLFSALMIYYFLSSRHNIFKFGVNRIYIWFILFSIYPMMINPSLTTGIGYWLRWMQGILVLNMTVLIVIEAGNEQYRKRMQHLSWSVFVAFIMPLFLYFKNMIQGQYIVSKDLIRYSDFNVTFAFFAYSLLAVLPFCLFLYLNTKNRLGKILWISFILILLCVTYLTYVRIVWISVAVIFISLNVMKKRYISSMLIIVVVFIMITFNPLVQKRLEDLTVIVTSDKTFFDLSKYMFNQRMGMWQANIRYFFYKSDFAEKLLGNPIDTLRSSVYMMLPGGTRVFEKEHNNFLLLLMHTGIVGLTIYIVYIIKLFQEAFKLYRSTKDPFLENVAIMFICTLSSFVISSLGNHLLLMITYMYYFSVFAGLIVAANLMRDMHESGKIEFGNSS